VPKPTPVMIRSVLTAGGASFLLNFVILKSSDPLPKVPGLFSSPLNSSLTIYGVVIAGDTISILLLFITLNYTS